MTQRLAAASPASPANTLILHEKHSPPSIKQLTIAAALLCLPNIMLWWAQWQFGFQRPWFNLDYAPAMFAWLLGWRKTGMALAVLALLPDTLAAAVQVYLIYEPWQMLQLLGYTGDARPEFQLAGIVFVVFSLSAYYGCSRLAPRAGTRATLVMLCPVVLANLPALWHEAQQQQANLHIDRRTVVLGSQGEMLYRVFFRSQLGAHIAKGQEPAHFTPWPQVTASQSAWPESRPLPDKMLLIVAESFGLPLQAERLEAQLAPLTAPDTAFEVVSRGNVLFSGGTLAGEMRELCALRSSSISFGSVPQRDHCWPYRLRQQGYATLSLNPASGSMYRANEWYADIGFEKQIFFHNFPDPAQRCYSFPGWCDLDLLPYMMRQFQEQPRLFAYWLTMNTHIPYDRRDLRHATEKDCGTRFAKHDSQACRHFLLGREFFAGLAEALRQPGLSGLEVVIVGDHNPPFLEADARDSFDQQRVPFIHLRVR